MAVRCDDHATGEIVARETGGILLVAVGNGRTARDIKRLNGAVSIGHSQQIAIQRHSLNRAAIQAGRRYVVEELQSAPAVPRKLPELRRSRNWHTDSCHSSPCRCVVGAVVGGGGRKIANCCLRQGLNSSNCVGGPGGKIDARSGGTIQHAYPARRKIPASSALPPRLTSVGLLSVPLAAMVKKVAVSDAPRP